MAIWTRKITTLKLGAIKSFLSARFCEKEAIVLASFCICRQWLRSGDPFFCTHYHTPGQQWLLWPSSTRRAGKAWKKRINFPKRLSIRVRWHPRIWIIYCKMWFAIPPFLCFHCWTLPLPMYHFSKFPSSETNQCPRRTRVPNLPTQSSPLPGGFWLFTPNRALLGGVAQTRLKVLHSIAFGRHTLPAMGSLRPIC